MTESDTSPQGLSTSTYSDPASFRLTKTTAVRLRGVKEKYNLRSLDEAVNFLCDLTEARRDGKFPDLYAETVHILGDVDRGISALLRVSQAELELCAKLEQGAIAHNLQAAAELAVALKSVSVLPKVQP